MMPNAQQSPVFESAALQRLQGRRVLVIGLGKTGYSCARFLAGLNIDVAVTDSRAEPPYLQQIKNELPDVAVFVGGFDAIAFRRADLLVISPGISLREPLVVEARARGAQVVGDIELFAWFVQAPVIAITGSNGKSTVTTMVGQMAARAGRRVAVGGNLGTPALDLLTEQVELYVLELSSFQLETTRTLNACAAALLNISEDHMDRYANLADYTAAKARIFHGDGVLVVNADDARVMATAKLFGAARKLLGFSLGAPQRGGYGITQHAGQRWLTRDAECLLAVNELKLSGDHNLANALAALALGEAAGLPLSPMLDALRDFTGLPHRCQWVAETDAVIWINDSKATNVGAALAAINGIQANKLVLIMGGQGKGQDFQPLKQAVEARARSLILLGEDAPKIARVFSKTLDIVQVASMAEAVQVARSKAQPGDVVLLSPACASFDMFKAYDHRGEVFAACVREGQS